jgi:hypothetical protein
MWTVKELLKEFEVVHPHKYIYPKFKYHSCFQKIKIICKIHGSFLQGIDDHLQGRGCQECGGKLKSNVQEFIAKCIIIWEDTYDLSRYVYANSRTKGIVRCRKINHGYFLVSPNNFLRGKGCPKCSSSQGERYIREWLIDRGIFFEEQKKFNGCRHKGQLSYDFYIPSLNLLIEFNGEQHFKPIKWFGGPKTYGDIKKRDAIKTKWAKDNNYQLLHIKYTDFYRVGEILEKEVLKIKSI